MIRYNDASVCTGYTSRVSQRLSDLGTQRVFSDLDEPRPAIRAPKMPGDPKPGKR